MTWIIKNPILYWYLIPFLLEAVEASLCHFLENWLVKFKCPNLLKPLGTIILPPRAISFRTLQYEKPVNDILQYFQIFEICGRWRKRCVCSKWSLTKTEPIGALFSKYFPVLAVWAIIYQNINIYVKYSAFVWLL